MMILLTHQVSTAASNICGVLSLETDCCCIHFLVLHMVMAVCDDVQPISCLLCVCCQCQ